MNKSEIVERLIDQGHIIVKDAARILNKNGEYIQDIQDLHRDGQLSTKEVIVLLRDGISLYETKPGIQHIPTITYPWNLDDSGKPWCSTTSLNS